MIPLTDVLGVGESLAHALRSHGFHTARDLAAAKPEDLTAVPRIGSVRAALLIASAREVVGARGNGAAPGQADELEAAEARARAKARKKAKARAKAEKAARKAARLEAEFHKAKEKVKAKARKAKEKLGKDKSKKDKDKKGKKSKDKKSKGKKKS
ncbi:Helix-hairpin-helix domain-containing protein [Cribrihabitans marinus]|uniref:Helix-hairpin-helix domain-containing protein n=1 Tax=Cribrihabitans marinus TaxID=1227549 RepID=A0A1H6VDZ5_9RHOB|nr:helix-hairpin-helix domain-containing protein [Cribrihabitans marinus]GGH26473.1 hypothetical protein GCM10010973_14260 [Cribrihabitans marinus]SEI98522.1 Helix-hairpin-helix domain-containing protein [Cribrihabitans marinus]